MAGVKQIAALAWVAFASTASGSEARRLECYSAEDRSRASGLLSPGLNASGPCEGGLGEKGSLEIGNLRRVTDIPVDLVVGNMKQGRQSP